MLSAAQLERLFLTHEKALFNIALRWTFDRERAEDLVQEAFVRVWDRRAGVAPDTAPAYIYQTLLNLARNLARRRSTRQRLQTLLAPLWPQHEPREPSLAVDHQALAGALERLSAGQRNVVLMCEFSGLTQVEIGQALGIAPGTVASRRHTALARLKELME